jgi:DNA-binding response OmpR family regulator
MLKTMVGNQARSDNALERKPANLSPRILVVEDDFAIRKFHTDVLVRSGYQVHTAEDGLAGWEALHAHHFDLLITDHHMPNLSGLDLVAKVRSAKMPLPVILVTTPLPKEELDRNPSLKLAANLPKPFSPDQLEKAVKKVLRATGRTIPRTQSRSAGQ